MRTIAIADQKSGSGKTNTARCLCAVLAKEDRQRVLLVDVDQQADLNTRCDVEGEGASPAELSFFCKPQVKQAPLENKLERMLETVADEFDIALLDLPSSLGLLTVNGLVAAQEVLIPARPEFIDLRALA